MTTYSQNKEDSWEKRHVQCVLEYHNKKYGTHIAIGGKTQDVRPDLKGKSDWDWVCCDTETGDEIALEVKKLTDQALEAKDSMMWQFLEKVRDSLSTKLPGTFGLHVNIPGDYYLPIKGQKDKQELQDLLCTMIDRTAPRLQVGEEADLKRKIIILLRIMKKEGERFYIPRGVVSCKLYKYSDEGNVLALSPGLMWWQSLEIEETELEQWEQMVSHANEQLQKANVKETFLVFIEGHSGRKPSALEKAFSSIKQESYSAIKYVYFVIGEEVTKVRLPTP